MLPRGFVEEVRNMAVVWNFPFDLHAIMAQFGADPGKIRFFVEANVEGAIGDICFSDQPEIVRESFVIWLTMRRWMNKNNEMRDAAVIKLSSSLGDPKSVMIVKESFAEHPSFAEHFHLEGGGDPILEGAIPIYWYGEGTVVCLTDDHPAELMTFCAAEYDERVGDTLASLLGSSRPNPYR